MNENAIGSKQFMWLVLLLLIQIRDQGLVTCPPSEALYSFMPFIKALMPMMGAV
ncbi:MAG: hypothetical protein FWG30_05755 [Eubacteriaceae bacterium]|nr:hypothetical protein [Eubacteriaceae bacterium]